MKVIAIASRQPRVGKTMLAAHAAVAAQAIEYSPAVIIDMDPERGAESWSIARGIDIPYCVRSTPARLKKLLAKLREAGVGLAVIDTPTFQPDIIRDAIAAADAVLVPISIAGDAIASAETVVSVASKHSVPALLVMNAGASANGANVAGSAAGGANIPCEVIPNVVERHAIIAESMLHGGTVLEFEPFGAAAREIHEVWSYIVHRLEEDGDARPAEEESRVAVA